MIVFPVEVQILLIGKLRNNVRISARLDTVSSIGIKRVLVSLESMSSADENAPFISL